MNAWIHSRRFIDILEIHTLILGTFGTTYYEVGKLAFDLLPILLPRIKGPAVSWVQDILLCFPTFDLIQDDPLGSEKVKAMQAIEEFLKMWFWLHFMLFSGADNSELDRNKAASPCIFSYIVAPPPLPSLPYERCNKLFFRDHECWRRIPKYWGWRGDQKLNKRYHSTLWWGNFNWGRGRVNMSYVISINSFSTCADELPSMDDGEKSRSITRVEMMILKKPWRFCVFAMSLTVSDDLYGQRHCERRTTDINMVFSPRMKMGH